MSSPTATAPPTPDDPPETLTPKRANVHPASLDAAFARFSAAFPGSFPDAASVRAKKAVWQEMLIEHPWVDEPTWNQTVRWLLWNHQGEYLPGLAIVLETARRYHRAAQDKARTAAVLGALPAPAPSSSMLPDTSPDAPATPSPVSPPDNAARYRTLVKAHAARGERLRLQHAAIVRDARLREFPDAGARSAWIRQQYQASVDADPRPTVVVTTTPTAPAPPPARAGARSSAGVWPWPGQHD